MKKKFVFVLAALLLFFTVTLYGSKKVNADEIAGKVIFHYQLWDQDYSSAGLWVWNTGSGGSSNAVTSDKVDSFGAVYEINVASDASDTIGIIALRKDITLDSRWDYRETPDGENFFLDVTDIKSGKKEEIHVYYFQGGYQTYFVAEETKVNVLVCYYDPTAAYEGNLGLHTWGSYVQEELNSVGWGTPAKVFKDGFKSPGDVKGKVALLSIDEKDIANAGFLIYAGDDATKKTPENACLGITDWADLKNGSVNVLYVTGGKTYYGQNALRDFAENSFKFDFIGFNATEVSGTYAVDPRTIFVKTTLALPTKEVIGKETVTKTRTVLKPQVKEGGTAFTQTDKTFPSYSASELPSGALGKVVVHYQRWNGDYTDNGVWTWNGGTGSVSVVPMSGVDNFGAVIELPIYADASDTIGFICLNKGVKAAGNDWPEGVDDSNKGTGNIDVDVTSIKNGTVKELHVYAFEGDKDSHAGYNTSANLVNIFVVYYDLSGNYEENLGVHSWGNWVTEGMNGAEWTKPVQVFSTGLKSPKGIEGKVALIQIDEKDIASAGFLVYAGDDATKKTPENAFLAVTDWADLKNGSVNLVYIALDKAFYGKDAKADFATTAFSGEIEWVEVEEEYQEEVDVLGVIDYKKYFKLMCGNDLVDIESINFNQTASSTNEFVINLKNALDTSKEYTLYYSNGATGEELVEANVKIDMDTEKPVITLISDEEIVIKQGEKWDPTLFPLYKVTDNRDTNLTGRVYVKSGHGTLNTNVPGDYPITLVVEDTFGNFGELTFNIKVVAVETSGCKSGSAIMFSVMSALGLLVFFIRRRFN